MAIVKAPFLSLGASGKFANTLVASTWKGLKTMRSYVVPSNPNTADQQTQRTLFSACVSAFRNYLTAALGRTAWDRSALASGKAQSGFNVAMAGMLGILTSDADASFCNTGAAIAGNFIEFTMLNMDDGAAGDEAGNFEIWVGNTPTSLLLSELVAIAGSKVTGTVDLGVAGDIVYAKTRKDSYDRGGIFKFTLID